MKNIINILEKKKQNFIAETWYFKNENFVEDEKKN